MVALLLLLLSWLAAAPHAGLESEDAAVYLAVLNQTVQPKADRLTVRTRGAEPSRVVVVDRTIALCPHARMGGCLGEWLEDYFKRERTQFAAAVDSVCRAELIAEFMARNGTSTQVSLPDSEAVITPGELREALDREQGKNERVAGPMPPEFRGGYVSFSLPAYSARGLAVVFADYICGGLCGRGWLVVLQRSDRGWQVLAAEVLHMS